MLAATIYPGSGPDKGDGDEDFDAWTKLVAILQDLDARQVAAATDLIAALNGLTGKQPLDATLTALAGLTLSADKMIYATGADAVATAALTSFARSILDDANAAAVRATLGLGAAALLGVGTAAGTVAAGDDARLTGTLRYDVAQALAFADKYRVLTNAGALPNRAFASLNTLGSTTAVIPLDDTIPQINEGAQLVSVSLTPRSVTSRIRLRAQGWFMPSNSNSIILTLFDGLSTNALQTTVQSINGAGGAVGLMTTEHEYVPGVTTPLTFSARYGPAGAATAYVNGISGSRYFGGSSSFTLVAEEILV